MCVPIKWCVPKLLCDWEMPTMVSKWQLLNVAAFFYAWVPKKFKMQPSTPSIWCVLLSVSPPLNGNPLMQWRAVDLVYGSVWRRKIPRECVAPFLAWLPLKKFLFSFFQMMVRDSSFRPICSRVGKPHNYRLSFLLKLMRNGFLYMGSSAAEFMPLLWQSVCVLHLW